jgi:hypothetical protein
MLTMNIIIIRNWLAYFVKVRKVAAWVLDTGSHILRRMADDSCPLGSLKASLSDLGYPATHDDLT